MSPDDVQHVQRTSRVLLSIGQPAFDAFYDELFKLAPETRGLFCGDMAAQKLKLMDMIACLIGAVREPERFEEIAYHLGQRHVRYGVSPEHYVIGGRALIACLEKALGQEFTPQVRDAWLALYEHLADAMHAAAAPPSRPVTGRRPGAETPVRASAGPGQPALNRRSQ